MRRIRALVKKEFRQVFRDRDMLRIIFMLPLIQLFIFGYAANTDLRNVTVSLLDQDHSRASRLVAEAFQQSDVFVLGPAAHDPQELQQLVLDEKAKVVVWIPRGFEEDLALRSSPQLSIQVDGQNGGIAGRASGYASTIVQRTVARLQREAGHPPAAEAGVTGVTRYFYNPELESRFFMVPGILVLLITVISTLLTAMAVVREKEIGTLEQLMVSPLSSAQLIAGKTIPFVMISFVELSLATAVAMLWFRLPLAGSLPLLALAALLYLLVTMGVGLLASTVSATQQQAMFTAWFFLVFGILMSGFFYPIENMPTWAQHLTLVNPMRWMMNVVRGLFLKGASFGDIALDLAMLAAMGLATFGAAVARFQKRVG